ncbi:MAG: DUF1987 domain-containing protein [Bacteroidales bacterium]|nr:DUF1987 domain-containing protein [Bacteroidales bacterium]
MEKIYLTGKDDSPEVIIDVDKNLYEISGRSIPENANLLYNNIIDWFKQNLKDIEEEIELSIQLEYYNSASAKKIIELLLVLEEYSQSNNNIKVIWYYFDNDLNMEKKGRELFSIINIPFEIRNINND